MIAASGTACRDASGADGSASTFLGRRVVLSLGKRVAFGCFVQWARVLPRTVARERSLARGRRCEGTARALPGQVLRGARDVRDARASERERRLPSCGRPRTRRRRRRALLRGVRRTRRLSRARASGSRAARTRDRGDRALRAAGTREAPGFGRARSSARSRAKPGPDYVVANADEGDPGAFVDRFLLEDDPHAVLEGLAPRRVRDLRDEGLRLPPLRVSGRARRARARDRGGAPRADLRRRTVGVASPRGDRARRRARELRLRRGDGAARVDRRTPSVRSESAALSERGRSLRTSDARAERRDARELPVDRHVTGARPTPRWASARAAGRRCSR